MESLKILVVFWVPSVSFGYLQVEIADLFLLINKNVHGQIQFVALQLFFLS